MKISMNMKALTIIFEEEEVGTEGTGIKITKHGREERLHLSHEALRKVERAIETARGIQKSSLKNNEGSMIVVFKASI